MRIAPPLALALLVACGSVDGGPADPPTGPAAVRVTHYDLELALPAATARATVTMAVERGGDCVSLAMRSAPGEVTLDGAPAARVAVTDGVLTACGAGWPAGAELVLAVDTTLVARATTGEQLGYSVAADREGADVHQLISWFGGCDRFGPCDRAPDRFARYRFAVDHPPGMQVLCPGVLTPGETRSECVFDFAGGPTYSTYGLLAGSSWTRHPIGATGGVDLVLYDTPSTGFLGDLPAEQVTGFLAWMIDQFGPYPYGDELRLIAAPTYWSGFEHPGNVTLNDRLNRGLPPSVSRLRHTTLHEIAHQWAGDQATLAGTYDFVWKEAMAEYLAYFYEDEAIDPLVARGTASGWKLAASGAAYHPVPGDEPALVDYYGDVYGAGPMILFRQLEAIYGRPAILAALGELLGAERFLAIDDVLAALERATGAELDAYAEAWLFGSGAPSWPVFELTTTPRDGGVTVSVAQRDAAAGLYGCAFAVELRGAGEGEVAEAVFDLGVAGAATAAVDVDLGFAVTSTVFDPHGSCLASAATPGVAAGPRPPRTNPFVASPETPHIHR
jgi:aminopeptidase N